MRSDLVPMVKDGVEARVIPDNVESMKASGWRLKSQPQPKPKTKPETSEAE